MRTKKKRKKNIVNIFKSLGAVNVFMLWFATETDREKDVLFSKNNNALWAQKTSNNVIKFGLVCK